VGAEALADEERITIAENWLFDDFDEKEYLKSTH
jgi:hypothetical protein